MVQCYGLWIMTPLLTDNFYSYNRVYIAFTTTIYSHTTHTYTTEHLPMYKGMNLYTCIYILTHIYIHIHNEYSLSNEFLKRVKISSSVSGQTMKCKGGVITIIFFLGKVWRKWNNIYPALRNLHQEREIFVQKVIKAIEIEIQFDLHADWGRFLF